MMNVNFVPNITDNEVDLLAKSLSKNTSITALDLANNQVGFYPHIDLLTLYPDH